MIIRKQGEEEEEEGEMKDKEEEEEEEESNEHVSDGDVITASKSRHQCK